MSGNARMAASAFALDCADMAQPVTRPDRELAAKKREKFVNTGEASEMLNGVISSHILRDMALRGEIPGAILVRQRVLLPRRVVPTLVKELEYQAVLPQPKKIVRRSFGPLAV